MEKSGTKCAHHWVIDTPSGPTSSGTCILCGEHRDGFKNHIEEKSWMRTDDTAGTYQRKPDPRTETQLAEEIPDVY